MINYESIKALERSTELALMNFWATAQKWEETRMLNSIDKRHNCPHCSRAGYAMIFERQDGKYSFGFNCPGGRYGFERSGIEAPDIATALSDAIAAMHADYKVILEAEKEEKKRKAAERAKNRKALQKLKRENSGR
jgi:hypothetical protein